MARKRFIFFFTLQTVLKRIFLLFLLGILALISSLVFHGVIPVSVVAQERSITPNNGLQAIDSNPLNPLQEAQKLNRQARQELEQGQSQLALDTWKEAEKFYRQAKDEKGVIGSQLNQAEALQSLGRLRAALKKLEELQPDLEKQPDLELKAIGFLSLGNALRSVGDLAGSYCNLRQGLDLVSNDNVSYQNLQGDILLSLGNTMQSTGERLEQKAGNIPHELLSENNWKKNINSFNFDCKGKNYHAFMTKLTIVNSYKYSKDFYQQVEKNSSTNLTIKINSQINYLSLLIHINESLIKLNKPPLLHIQKEANEIVYKIQSTINDLPQNLITVYARINFANSLNKFRQQKHNQEQNTQEMQEIEKIWDKTLQLANYLQNTRVESYVLGYLGNFYETIYNLPKAKQYTENALYKAIAINKLDMIYQWQWQLGRILKQENNIPTAIKFYNSAVETINDLRNKDLLGLGFNLNNEVNLQFDFRENIEPVYKELVNLLLLDEKVASNKETKNLKQVLQVMDSFQITELQNFLGCSILPSQNLVKSISSNQKLGNIDDILDNISKQDTHAALIYPIILNDRLEIIVYRNQKLKHYSSKVDKQEIEQISQKISNNLKQHNNREETEILSDAQKLYNLLFKQLAPDLEKNQVKTLVFVLEGVLRNIPMAILHDGTHYLAEKNYSIALVPSLQLLDAKPLNRSQLTILGAGLTEKTSNFPPLQFTETELKEIQKILNSAREPLLNKKFTEHNIQNQLKLRPASVIHLATHAKFSSDIGETFIVTGEGNIGVQELNNFLQTQTRNSQEKLELFTLSACETAKDDKQAALGLAGVAVKAGAKSTLATLWPVNDESTAILMIEFYKELKSGNSNDKNIAEALRRAQMTLKNNNNWKDPYYWAPFVLVGNWM